MPYKDREKGNRIKRERYAQNPELFRVRNHEWYAKHREQQKAKRNTDEQRCYKHYYYQEHKERINALVLAYARKKGKWIEDYKRTVKCSVCGQSFPDCPSVMDFHHVDEKGKLAGIGRMRDVPRARLQAELAKCIPLCANCHRRTHFLEDVRKEQIAGPLPDSPNAKRSRALATRKRRNDWLNNIKMTKKCSMCGQSFPDCPKVLDFHHTGKDPKNRGVGRMTTRSMPEKLILAEIEKCVPLCANCHRRVHARRRQNKKKGSVPVSEPLADDYPEQWGLFR